MRALLFPVLAITVLVVVHRWATRTFPPLGRHPRWFALGLVGLLATVIASREAEVHWHFGGTLELLTLGTLTTLMLAGGPIAVLHLGAALVARLRRPATPPPVEAAAALTRRQVVEATGGLALLGASGTMLGWGIVRGRHAFELREVPVRIAGLPRALDGYVIAQVSDLHAGYDVGEDLLDEGMSRVREARPDLVVVTGDMVDVDASFAPLVARKLADLAPRDGIFACLGNHDHYAGARAVTQVLRDAGITPLVNDGRILRAGDGGGFALLGVDDLIAERSRGGGVHLDQALSTVRPDAPRVLLSHQPPTVRRWPGRVALQLSGHTHGGQLNPGGLRLADLIFEYVAGRYQVGDTTLYVNQGFGTVGPPARLWAPPEVTRIVLVAG